MMEQEVNIERLSLTPSEKNYLEHKRCFSACVSKDFKEPTLKDDEKVCIKNCLFKYRDAEKFMIDKIHRTMETLIRSDMTLMASYRDEEERKNPQQH